MDLKISPGKYLLAVSGGVDSMVLLSLLVQMPGVDVVVAHFQHGIRPDDEQDRLLVAQAAARHKLPFIYEQGNLGMQTSEQVARAARYDFLRRAQAEYQAQAIVTAHHQDDVLETMLLNVLRGTNRRGLSSLQSHAGLVRPLLHIPKNEIKAYAQAHQITWREDNTNSDARYMRNNLRLRVMPRLQPKQRSDLLTINKTAHVLNQEIDMLVADTLTTLGGPKVINRQQFIQLPHAIAREVMAAWLRAHNAPEITSRQIERLVVAAKTARNRTTHDINKLKILNIGRKFLEITPRKVS